MMDRSRAMSFIKIAKPNNRRCERSGAIQYRIRIALPRLATTEFTFRKVTNDEL